MSVFYIKQGDQLPVLDATLTSADGTAVDLTTAVSVVFRMHIPGTTSFRVNSAGSIVTPASGLVRYEWGATDTAVPGQYDAEFVVTFPGSKTLTCPTVVGLQVFVQDSGLTG